MMVQKYEVWIKDTKKVAEIRGQDLIFKRGKGPKKLKGSLIRIKIK